MSNEKITCKECGAQVHLIEKHLKEAHPGMSLADYQAKHPGEPVMSALAERMVNEQRAKLAAQKAAPTAAAPAGMAVNFVGLAAFTAIKVALHEAFELGKVKAAMRADGSAVQVTAYKDVGSPEMVPSINDGYVFDIDELRTFAASMELNIPTYIYGHKGSGKSDLVDQFCARTGRPTVRVQHTINTEESHIVGQWAVENGETLFHYGPLPQAMINGWTYLADEYDFALPSVTSVYQAVLEGKPLYIKEAPPAQRIVKPHPNFRFVATGNTNGSGDETGLYGGTQMQNSANYDRFGCVLHKQYMNADAEKRILMNKTGLQKEDAERMVQFAGLVRTAYGDGKISDTVSPRALINAVKMGAARGSFRTGLAVAFINKLSSVDRKVVDDIAQRVFS